jgi:hypothetical protein
MGIVRPSRIIYRRMSGANRQRIAVACLTSLHQIEVVYRGFADSRGYAVVWGYNAAERSFLRMPRRHVITKNEITPYMSAFKNGVSTVVAVFVGSSQNGQVI